MAGITHAKVSAIEDGADTTLVRPSDWNAAHLGLTIVRKTADETVNNSSDLQNDNHLLLAIAASEIWLYEFTLYLVQGAASTAHWKGAITAPSGASGVYGALYMGVSSTAGTHIGTATLGTGLTLATATNDIGIITIFAIIINSTTAGNVQLQWAQTNANAVNTTVKAGSNLVAHKLS